MSSHAPYHEIRSLLRWTLFLFGFLKALLILILILSVVLIFGLKTINVPGLIFVFVFSLAFACWIHQVTNGLLVGQESSWGQAIAITGICLPSLFLPFALLSLRDLLSQTKKVAYLNKIHGAHNDEYTASSTATDRLTGSSPWRIITLAIIMGFGLIFISVQLSQKLESYWNKKEFFTSENFHVDPKLALPALARLGAECNTKGNSDCSIAVYGRILELDPGNNTAIANLAIAESLKGLHSKAIEHFETYFAHGGGGVDAMAFFATSMNAVGQKEKALKWYMKALALAPNLLDVAQRVSSLLMELGRQKEALQFINTFIKGNPTAEPYFREAIRELRSSNR